jgi:hypothetical protein
MSTDDLTRRARAAARGLKPTVPGTSALLSELADEVDRLREFGRADDLGMQHVLEERDAARARVDELTAYIATQPHHSDLAQIEGERDAAQAALERVRAIATDTSGRHPSTRILNPQDILDALKEAQ